MGRISQLAERIVIEAVQRGIFQIDTEGRVWRLARGGRRRAEHRVPKGYLQVRWMKDGVRYHALAHRLVWQYFKGDIPPGEEINHDNGLKDDNHPRNLLCGTSGKNAEHAHRFGLKDQHGQRNPAHKLTDNQVAQIRLAYSKGGYTMEQLGARFGVSFQAISKIVRGQRRPKQGGPIAGKDQRRPGKHRDNNGRFTAGRELDGRTWSEFPKHEGATA